jgi:aminoglycoside 3-N-acetyltransferase
MSVQDPQNHVTINDLTAALERIGARGKRLIAHAALSSFGHVGGGADTVIDALLEVADTVLVPTFTYSPAAAVPADDRPARNGADYELDPCGGHDPTPFTRDLEVARPIGVVPETLRRRPGALRSDHPLSSFAAIGPRAEYYVGTHDWNEPMQPIERLYEDDGLVLMLGAPLTSCTAVHLAEKLLGRRPFIRWARLPDGTNRRVRVGSCSNGFEKLRPGITGVQAARVGKATVELFSARAVVGAAMRALSANPLALACDELCQRCRDAAAGGPLE